MHKNAFLIVTASLRAKTCIDNFSEGVLQPPAASSHPLWPIKKVLTMKNLLILIAGPVRSGTQNRPELIEANLNNMAQVALSVYKKGHIPVVGEWLALPIAKAAGSTEIGDAISEEYLYPVAHRLISRCDAILRLPGESRGADLDIEEGKKRGLSIYYSLEEIPDR